MSFSEEDDLHSRRILLYAGAAGLGATVLAGCAGNRALRIKIRGGAKVAPTDVQALNALLDLEHYAIAAYTAGIPLLHGAGAKASQQFLAHELAHAVQLSDLIRRAGGKPDKPRSYYDLGHPRGAQDILAFLKRLELAQLGAYLEAIPRLSGGRLRSTAAAIFANDAQHLAVLRSQTGERAVPAALVTGS